MSEGADLSGAPETPPERVVLVVPVAEAERVAAVAALVRQRVDVAPLDGRGCVVAPQSATTDPDGVAAALSRAVPAAPLLVLRSDVGADGGAVRVEQWTRGSRDLGADVESSPGLVLANLPDDVERVLHGAVGVPDLPGATTSAGMGRLTAARAAAGRGGRAGGPASRPPGFLGPVLLGLLAAALLVLEALALADGDGSWVVAAVALVVLVWAAGSVLRVRAARAERTRRGGP